MKKISMILTCVIMLFFAGTSRANLVYWLDVFTQNGIYADSSDIDLYCQVAESDAGVNFTFHNDSAVNSSISNIFFDGIGLLAYSSITNGQGTLFTRDSSPGTLPAGSTLVPSFAADMSFSASPPPSQNGINPGQWITIGFNYAANATIADVVNALNDGMLRFGVHLVGLPDGSSEAAVTVPEPATISSLAFGVFLLTKRRKRN